jgi:hypothetical protein
MHLALDIATRTGGVFSAAAFLSSTLLRHLILLLRNARSRLAFLAHAATPKKTVQSDCPIATLARRVMDDNEQDDEVIVLGGTATDNQENTCQIAASTPRFSIMSLRNSSGITPDAARPNKPPISEPAALASVM